MRNTIYKRPGFTLIELLVVIAIIALLVSILMPSLSRARDLAKSAMCKTNLRGLGNTIAMYQSEYDGLFPGFQQTMTMAYYSAGLDNALEDTENYYWRLILANFMDTKPEHFGLLECPSEELGPFGWFGSLSYLGNAHLGDVGSTWRRYKRVDDIVNPSNTFALTDCAERMAAGNRPTLYPAINVLLGFRDQLMGYRHDPENEERQNTLFTDLHVSETSFMIDYPEMIWEAQ